MKDFTGVSPSTLPDPADPTFVPRLRSMMSAVDIYLREVSRGLSRIQQGQVPDGSGESIGDTPSLDGVLANYLYLPGRVGGQTIRSADDANPLLAIRPGTEHTANVLEIYDAAGNLEILVDSTGRIRSADYSGITTNTAVTFAAHSGVPRLYLFDTSDSRYEATNGTNLGFRYVGGADILTLSFSSVGSAAVINSTYSAVNDSLDIFQVRRSNTHTADLLQFRKGTTSTNTLLSRVKADGTWEGPISTTGSVVVTDSTFRIQDNADNTKLLAFELGGFTTATTRTLTPQNASYTLAGTNVAQTFTKAQIIAADSDVVGLRINSNVAQSVNVVEMYDVSSLLAYKVDATGVSYYNGSLNITDGNGAGSAALVAIDALSVTASRAWSFPNSDGTVFVGTSASQTLTSKIVSSGGVALTGQTASITTTNITISPSSVAMYLVEVFAMCTTASGSGAPTLDVTIGWTDTVGATTQNVIAQGSTAFPMPLSATGRAFGSVIVRRASGNITYATTINAASGSPQYALYIRVLGIG